MSVNPFMIALLRSAVCFFWGGDKARDYSRFWGGMRIPFQYFPIERVPRLSLSRMLCSKREPSGAILNTNTGTRYLVNMYVNSKNLRGE